MFRMQVSCSSVLMLVLAGSVAAAPFTNVVPAARAKSKCASSPNGTGLLFDGDFHLRTDPGKNYDEYPKTARMAPGWRVRKGTVDLVGSTRWPMPYHLCIVDLDGNTPGGIKSRELATTPSSNYTVAFQMSGNGDCGSKIETMELQVAGQEQQFTWNTANNNDAQHGVYQFEQWSFAATASTTKLVFLSLDTPPSGCGPIVAGIAVTPSTSQRTDRMSRTSFSARPR